MSDIVPSVSLLSSFGRKSIAFKIMADTGSAECRSSASSADQTVDLRDCTIPCFDQYHLNAANGVEPSSVMALVGSVPQQDHVSAAATTAATSDNWMFQQTQQHVQIPYWAMNQTPIPIEQFGKEAFNYMMILPSGSLPDGQQLGKLRPCNFCMLAKQKSISNSCART